MTETTDELIRRLAADAAPVRRLRPPVLRAVLWLIAVGALAALFVAWLADMESFMTRAQGTRQAIELAATLATGILAIVAAFELSLPDRRDLWALLPVPALALWLATAGLGCLRSWTAGIDGDLVESLECFAILTGASLPIGATLLVLLRRARPLAPGRVAAMGGLGVAGLAAFLLQFFHPFDVTVLDLAIHAVAVALVIAACAAAPRWAAA